MATLFGSSQGGTAGGLLIQFFQVLEDRDGAIHRIERASSVASGTAATGDSRAPSISGDGRYVAFHSKASDLVAGDTNGINDIFVYDSSTHVTTRVSGGSGAAQATGVGSFHPSISSDGRFIAFDSAAPNLVTGDTNGTGDIFVYDSSTLTTKRVSVSSSGAQGTTFPSEHPSITSDGTGRYKVAFASSAPNLVGNDTNGFRDIFIYDSVSRVTQRISLGTGGQASGNSDFPVISSTGIVAFESDAPNLVSNDTNNVRDVFFYNGMTVARAVPSGILPNGASGQASISANGNFIAFESLASNLVQGDTNSVSDIFVYNAVSRTIERVSVGLNSAQANSDSHEPSISGDGRFVTFWSRASNLVPGDPADQIFVYDRELRTTRLVSVSAVGEKANGHSAKPVISADGTHVAFESAASNLFRADQGFSDVFVTDALQFFNSGGPGDDVIRSALGNDVLDGGRGNNTVSYEGILAAVTASLAITGAQNTGGAGTDKLLNFQKYYWR